MKCTDLGNVARDETPESLPSHARALAAAPNGVHPGPADFGSEHSEPFEIARHGVIVQVALYDALEPRADHFDFDATFLRKLARRSRDRKFHGWF